MRVYLSDSFSIVEEASTTTESNYLTNLDVIAHTHQNLLAVSVQRPLVVSVIDDDAIAEDRSPVTVFGRDEDNPTSPETLYFLTIPEINVNP